MENNSKSNEDHKAFKNHYWYLRASFVHYIKSGALGNFEVSTSLLEAIFEVYSSDASSTLEENPIEKLIIAKTEDKIAIWLKSGHRFL
ncbi:MAG TPA: hypothetical protein VNW99_12445 [Cytophagaceae bacterium]|jgi:hypothetical protein|nr:hypothetical protein [Cytophagaceae bacterium]